jgi:hypothetical protein
MMMVGCPDSCGVQLGLPLVASLGLEVNILEEKPQDRKGAF